MPFRLLDQSLVKSSRKQSCVREGRKRERRNPEENVKEKEEANRQRGSIDHPVDRTPGPE